MSKPVTAPPPRCKTPTAIPLQLWDRLTGIQRQQLANLIGQLLLRRLMAASSLEVSHDDR
jgi:hypothetical protein